MSETQGAATTQVFVPRIFDTPEERGVVVKAYKAEGEFVADGEPLVDLRSHDVDGEVVAPFAGTIVRLHAAHGDTVAAGTLLAELRADVPKPERPATSKARTRIGAQAPRLAALLCASGALLVPLLWLLAALIAALALAVARDLITRSDNGLPAAPLTLLPRLVAQFARWAGRSVARITPVLAALGGLLACVVLAVLIPAVVGGGLWLASYGGDGLAAAARIAVADHAFAVFAFLVCLWLAWRFWRNPGRAKAAIGAVRRMPPAVSLLASAAVIVWTAACVVTLPRSVWAPVSDFHEGANLLPVATTDWLLHQRASWVQSEMREVSDCLANAGRGSWRPPIVTLRGDGTTVVSLGPQPRTRPGDRSVATLLLATQNQLEPHGVTVVVHMDTRSARLRFGTVATRAPATDLAALLARSEATETAAQRLDGLRAFKPADVAVALRCSAAGP